MDETKYSVSHNEHDSPRGSPAGNRLIGKNALVREGEGREARYIGRILYWLYGRASGRIRSFIRIAVNKAERGPYFSRSIRAIFSRYHGVDVGMYSAFGCFIPFHFRANTSIGRYTTIYDTVQAFSANHPMNLKSSHAFFFNSVFPLVEKDLIQRNKLVIGNDVFLGHNAIILPRVGTIGDGAVIGAGSVVVHNVPPYAVVVGNPARIVRYRFSDAVIERLLAEQWWNKSLDELKKELGHFTIPLDGTETIR